MRPLAFRWWILDPSWSPRCRSSAQCGPWAHTCERGLLPGPRALHTRPALAVRAGTLLFSVCWSPCHTGPFSRAWALSSPSPSERRAFCKRKALGELAS